MDLTEKKVSEKNYFKGRLIDVYVDDILLPDGKPAKREIVKKGNAVCVVPLLENGDVVLVDQYRYPYSEVLTEIPAGKLEDGETPLEGAKRELEEETGLYGGKFICLGEFYPTPAIIDEILYLYVAYDLKKGQTHPDKDEFLNIHSINIDKLVEMIIKNEIKDGKTQAAVLKVAFLKAKGIIK